MKTVRMHRDFDFHVNHACNVSYRAGETYERVPEAQVAAIVAAKAGEVVTSKGDRADA